MSTLHTVIFVCTSRVLAIPFLLTAEVKCFGLATELTANVAASQNYFIVPLQYRLALGIFTFLFGVTEGWLNWWEGRRIEELSRPVEGPRSV